MPSRILGLVGSLREKSMNRALLRAVEAAFPEGLQLVWFERLGDIPPFNSDAVEPEPVTALKGAIRDADGVVIASPEYNYSVPGVLKNALDWVSRPAPTSPLRGKPIALVGASTGMSGGMRAQYHLRQIFVYSDSPVMMQPEVLVAKVGDKFDAEGNLIDEPTREHLRKFGLALQAHVTRFRRGAP
jgi:chromate reductase